MFKQDRKAKRKVQMMFFEINMQQERCRLGSYKLNCKKELEKRI